MKVYILGRVGINFCDTFRVLCIRYKVGNRRHDSYFYQLRLNLNHSQQLKLIHLIVF
jgi:hypothetical protein